MSRKYHFLAQQGASVVFANSTDLNDTITKKQSNFTPRGLNIPVYRDTIKIDRKHVGVPCKECDPAPVSLYSVEVTLQGQLADKALKLQALTDARAVIDADIRALNGYPPSPLEVIELPDLAGD